MLDSKSGRYRWKNSCYCRGVCTRYIRQLFILWMTADVRSDRFRTRVRSVLETIKIKFAQTIDDRFENLKICFDHSLTEEEKALIVSRASSLTWKGVLSRPLSPFSFECWLTMAHISLFQSFQPLVCRLDCRPWSFPLSNLPLYPPGTACLLTLLGLSWGVLPYFPVCDAHLPIFSTLVEGTTDSVLSLRPLL